MTEYSFSFTAAAMKYHDFRRLMDYLERTGIDPETESLDANEIMGRENSRTNKREFQELLKRYQALTPQERDLFPELDASGQKQLLLVAITRVYPYIHDFILDIIRDKFLTLDRQLTEADHRHFINRKRDLHPELDDFAISTARKARQILWKILEEGGLIDNIRSGHILPQAVHPALLRTILKQNAAELRIFLYSEYEISQMTATL